MLAEKQITEIFIEFTEIFVAIKDNDYSNKQKNEMFHLFEGQTTKKCLEFICRCFDSFQDISQISELVLKVIQKEKLGDFETKECFLELFDKAIAVHEKEMDQAEHVKISSNEDTQEYINDEIEELRKKNCELKSEIVILEVEAEDKSINLAKIEDSQIKLKYDYLKLNDQWETIIEENDCLRNKVANLTVQNDVDTEKSKVEHLRFAKEIRNLVQIVEDKDSQVSELLVEQKLLIESIEILRTEMKIKNCVIQEMEKENDILHSEGKRGDTS